MLPQLLLSGLAQGSAYALLGLGMTLLYRATGILNFAHGEFFMVAAYCAYLCQTSLGFGYVGGVVAAILVALLLGAIVELGLIRRVIHASHFQQVMVTVALSFLLRGIARAFWGQDVLQMPEMLSLPPFEVAGLIVTPQDLVILLSAILILLLFFAVLHGTSAGRVILAVSESPRGAALVGVNVPRFNALMWALAAGLGAVAGIVIAPITMLYPDMGAQMLLRPIAAMTLGGFGSFVGVVIGGPIVGITEALAGGYVSSSLTDVSSLLLIVLVLLIRPQGLLGRRDLVRV